MAFLEFILVEELSCTTHFFFSFLFLLVLIWFLHLLFMGSDQDQSLNVHSPYYLYSSESLLRILFHQFWTQWITIHGIDLCSLYWVWKNKVEFVNWSIQQPTLNHVLHSAWKKCNNIIVSCLVHSVSPSIRQSILWMDDALDIWKILKSCYSQGNLLWVSELQQDMASINTSWYFYHWLFYKITHDLGWTREL